MGGAFKQWGAINKNSFAKRDRNPVFCIRLLEAEEKFF
jgi:hypothetical protein